MGHRVIAIDLDDTLAATTPAVIAYAGQKLGKKLELGDITSVAYWARYGVNDRQAIELVHGYNLAGFPGLEPLEGAVEAIAQLANNYELHILTSRDQVSQQHTMMWLKQHFPAEAFSSIRLTGNQYVSKTFQSKAVLCADIEADVIIDDSLSHLSDCAAQGRRALLFGAYPWHPIGVLPANIMRAADWPAVQEYFNAKS